MVPTLTVQGLVAGVPVVRVGGWTVAQAPLMLIVQVRGKATVQMLAVLRSLPGTQVPVVLTVYMEKGVAALLWIQG